MAVEESYLLAMEKSGDMESCQCKTSSSDDPEGNSSEAQVSHPRFWTCVAFVLLTLTIVSGVFQFFDYRQLYHPIFVQLETLVPIANPLAVDATPAEADISKSMYFNIMGFGDIHSKRTTGPWKLYKSEGQTVVRDGNAYLTSEITTDENGVVPTPHSVGRLMHPRPFRVKHRGVNPGQERVVSFHTTFVFSIKNLLRDREATGDGFAFLMVPENNVMGSGGGYLGVMNSTDDAHTFAVEFDIWENPALQDISNNHVGINVNSMVSVLAAEAGYWSQDGDADQSHRFNRVDLTCGQIQAWIDYDGLSQELTVSISPELGSKPQKPLLSKRLDLTNVFEKYMYAGFSAATGEFSAKHIIHSWKFEKHSNPHPGGFTVPELRNPHRMRVDPDVPHHYSAFVFPSATKSCTDAIHELSATICSYFRRFSTGFLLEARELLDLWPYALLGFVLGVPLMHIALFLHQTCVGCCFGPVECYESTRELHDLAKVDQQGRFILVVSEPQQHPRVCSVV
ncbi:hypothetical protein Mapa_005312 [Marchantia paleacea]|nr:hypothetical protein Mapa_005312 [Marchantia paleacea]